MAFKRSGVRLPLAPPAPEPSQAARLIGVSRTKIYEALNSGALASFHIGRCRVIFVADLLAWVRSLWDEVEIDAFIARQRGQGA